MSRKRLRAAARGEYSELDVLYQPSFWKKLIKYEISYDFQILKFEIR